MGIPAVFETRKGITVLYTFLPGQKLDGGRRLSGMNFDPFEILCRNFRYRYLYLVYTPLFTAGRILRDITCVKETGGGRAKMCGEEKAKKICTRRAETFGARISLSNWLRFYIPAK